MPPFDPTAYGPEIAALLADGHVSPLGPGRPREHLRPLLQSFNPANAFAPHPVRDPAMAAACHSGLWLYHDFLDESHTISQGIDTPTGSFWHAIIHRREPDAWNSKYWWRRVGHHPVLAQLDEAAARLGWRTWDPVALVDECEAHRGKGDERESLLREVQLTEWQVLFNWCYQQAIR